MGEVFQNLAETPTRLSDFMETGGRVLWLILFVALALWTVLIERFIFFKFTAPRLVRRAVEKWTARRDTTSWYAKRIREAMIAEISIRLNQSSVLAGTLVALCPLLGILGTVTGMISVFEVLAYSGNGNVRGLAAGISQATLPTMSGLVVAISGLYFTALINRQAGRETARLADKLRHV
jgi:biopolymer transport protein ExbB